MKRGFTLIEILITLLVLIIGLTGSLALIVGTSRAGNKTIDRNIVGIILQDAIADIQRIHLVTATFKPDGTINPASYAGYGAVGVTPDDVGLYVETVYTGDFPNIQQALTTGADYRSLKVTDNTPTTPVIVSLLPQPNQLQLPSFPNELMWPISDTPRFYGTVKKTGSPVYTSDQRSAYRVIYRLERHPQWALNPAAPGEFNGVYVLTLAVYKDLNPTTKPFSQPVSVSNPAKKLEQISDPMIVYLHAQGGNGL